MFFRPLFGQTRAMTALGSLFSLVHFQNVSVKTSLKEGVQLIGINRPEKKNCVNHQTALELVAAFEQFERNHQAKIAVLYGEGLKHKSFKLLLLGGTFCAGYDLSEVLKGNFKVDDDFLPKYRYMVWEFVG